ncbi:MAG: nuclear transport factor 2 family protein [Candidatus Binatia bacterium]|jgi:ketosteroid isomerase-like protein
MSDDKDLVASVNSDFYNAFEKLDIKEMEKVWARGADIQCGHPGWRILRGWGPIMESWKRIFENTPAIQFMLSDVSIQINGTFAWVTLYENLNSKVEGQPVSATILTTNIFEKGAEGWRMIHHHGSSVAQQAPQSETPTVH